MLALHHVLNEHLGGKQGALEVQLEHEVHAGSVQVKEGLLAFLGFMLIFVVGGGPGIVAARAVHQDVAGSQVLEHLLMHFFQSNRVQHVGFVANAAIALGLQVGRQLLHGFFIQVQRRHLRTCLGIGPGHIAAQHAARAGHHNDLTGKIHVQGESHRALLLSIVKQESLPLGNGNSI